MKCIKNIKTGEIKRVKDELALTQVSSGAYVYVPKKDWKEGGRK